MFWFDKADNRALFVDKRRETHPIDIGTPGTIGRAPIVVDPDILADFRELPFPADSFSLVVFDPPHIERTAAKGLLTKKYGHLDGDWREMLRAGFAECFRVLRPEGTLIFKWAESDHPVSEILKLTPHRPLFGHRSGKSSATHWVAFLKQNRGIGQFDDSCAHLINKGLLEYQGVLLVDAQAQYKHCSEEQHVENCECGLCEQVRQRQASSNTTRENPPL